MELPIKETTFCSDATENRAYEIDLSNKKKLKSKLKVTKMDCYPILFVKSSPSPTEWSHKFKQTIAAKYMVIKLIESHKNNLNDNNIDMYNLTLNGYKLSIPSHEPL
jgi:hypothetical protein